MIYTILLFIFICILTFYVQTNSSFINQVDNLTLDFFHDFQSKLLDSFFSFITWFGSLWIIMPLFIALLFALIKNSLYSFSLYLSVGFLGAISTTYSLKYILFKKRPEIYQSITDLPKDPSFPSGHTTQVFIFTFLLGLVISYFDFSSKYLYLSVLFLLALFVAISRMYLQVHFLSDVIAGLIISIFWYSISYYLISQKELL